MDKNIIVTFAVNKMIWDEKPYYIPQSTKTFFKPIPKAKKCLSPKERKSFNGLLNEMDLFLNDCIEKLENTKYSFSSEETKILLAEKNEWLQIIKKLKNGIL